MTSHTKYSQKIDVAQGHLLKAQELLAWFEDLGHLPARSGLCAALVGHLINLAATELLGQTSDADKISLYDLTAALEAGMLEALSSTPGTQTPEADSVVDIDEAIQSWLVRLA